MKKIYGTIFTIALLFALPLTAWAAPNAVRVTDPGTHVSASIMIEAEDGAEVIPGPASTYGAYVRADNAPNLEVDEVEFSFNLRPKDGNHDRNANVTVAVDAEYAGWDATIYIQHDGSINKPSDEVSAVVADDGALVFEMNGLSTVTIILVDKSAAEPAEAEPADAVVAESDDPKLAASDSGSGNPQPAAVDSASNTDTNVIPFVIGGVVVVAALVAAVLIIRRRNKQ